MSEINQLFEFEVDLPNSILSNQSKSLIGCAERYARLSKGLMTLADSTGPVEWSQKNYGCIIPAVNVLSERYPLLIFQGDVGTGKTATAEAISNQIVRDINQEGHLFKLSTRVRGSGTVGQMSLLINQAFDIAIKEAGKARISCLIIDEADSLAASRGASQSHHEDKVGVNTLIQRIDDIRKYKGRVLVFLCTNRIDALDPAILRRAAYVEEFVRPNERERKQLLLQDLDGLGLKATDIDELVLSTGPQNGRDYGMTFSDIRTRLIPEAISRAYPDRKVAYSDFVEALSFIEPSPPVLKA